LSCQAEKVNMLQIVGDAFARPLVDELASGIYDLSTLVAVISGGAALSPGMKERLLEALPSLLMIVDAMGSSEGGSQAQQVSMRGAAPSSGQFGMLAEGSCILDDELSRRIGRDEETEGWMAKEGDVPLGYLGDAGRTASTFPVVEGIRYSVPGDRARWHADGTIHLLGRDSVTINSGGEKIFAEEVEAALRHHADVNDVVVAGRPSERWGQEVVAIVQLRPGAVVDSVGLSDVAAEHIARYKLPKDYIFVPEVVRSPAGKPDYRWAQARAADHRS
jgi:acyl-CoA synthetase (AMP-forming)/AMP-acid ligase II